MLHLEHAIFLALCGTVAIPYGLFAMIRFDSLIQRKSTAHPDVWKRHWYPWATLAFNGDDNQGFWLQRWVGTIWIHLFAWRWLFRAPKWIREDAIALEIFRDWQRCTLLSLAGQFPASLPLVWVILL